MRWFGTWLHRRRRFDDLSISIEEHLDEKIDEFVARGMPRREAEQAARRQFGNVALIDQRSREVWQWRWLERLWSDLRFSWRQAARTPLFALAVVATLAIGIGAESVVYSVIHAVLIDPYPYRDAMRMVHLHIYDKDPFPNDLGLTGPQFEQFKTLQVFDGAIAEDTTSMAKTDADLPEQVQIGRMSPDGFQFFGVAPQLGRGFTASDSPRVAVINYSFWNSHYAARADVIGKPLELDHVSFTIIGVMPQRFTWTGMQIYIPLEYSADPHRVARVFARLRAGVSDQAADQAIEPWIDAFVKETPFNFPPKFKAHVVHINEVAIGRFRGVLVILFVSVSFLLVLACVNVAILLLARGEARQAEIAMRKALGASRRRIVAQLLTESVLLSSAGGLGGVLLAMGGIRLIRHLVAPLPTLFPDEAVIALNMPVVLFSAGMAIATGVISGVWPAIRISRTDLRKAGNETSHKLASRHGTQKIHMALLTLQVAITILLLACSGATLRKLSQLMHASLGYEPANLYSVSLTLRDGAHNQWADRVHYFDQIRRTVESIPGIEAAAIGSLPPNIWTTKPISIPALNVNSGHITPQQVSPEYFSTLRIPLLHGRMWSTDEAAHAAQLAVVNEAFKRRYWPNSDPIGQLIILNNGVANANAWTLVAPGNNQHFVIIGVVGDSPNQGLDEEVSPGVYLPFSMTPSDAVEVVFRSQAEPIALTHSIKEQVRRIDAGQAVGRGYSATDQLEGDSLGREKFAASLFTAFAFLALVFAVCGLYCVQSYLVAQRNRELGVRLALGARRLHIIRLVTNSSLSAVAAGAAIGVVLSIMASRLFAQWTNGNSRDPATLALVVGVLLIAAFFASLGPAVAATSIAPAKSLQSE
jgi:predicted permease